MFPENEKKVKNTNKANSILQTPFPPQIKSLEDFQQIFLEVFLHL